MGAKARGQWSNFQLLSDRQWNWSSLASPKCWQIGRDLDANKEIQYTGLVSINKHVSIWLCVCMCLYWVFFPVNGCCISTSMHVCACEDRFRASSKMPSSTGKIWCWQPQQKGRKSDARGSSESTKHDTLTMQDLPLCWGRVATVGTGTNLTQGDRRTKHNQTCSWQTHQPGWPAGGRGSQCLLL